MVPAEDATRPWLHLPGPGMASPLFPFSYSPLTAKVKTSEKQFKWLVKKEVIITQQVAVDR